VYGSGFSLLLGFPLLLLINAPVLYFSSVTEGFLLVTLVMAVYFVLLWIAWSYLSRRS
jgi:ESS family glutamate:Na+ symporter